MFPHEAKRYALGTAALVIFAAALYVTGSWAGYLAIEWFLNGEAVESSPLMIGWMLLSLVLFVVAVAVATIVAFVAMAGWIGACLLRKVIGEVSAQAHPRRTFQSPDLDEVARD